MDQKLIMDRKFKIKDFYKYYINSLNKSLNEVDLSKLNKIVDILVRQIQIKKKIFVCGNGGSAAIAKHYICDYLKLLRFNTNLKPKIISLVDNIETITAISNDIDFSEIFKYQAESLYEKGDIIIIISSSGNSKNVVKLSKWAKSKKIKTISFTGFNGGLVRKLSSINININEKNYGRIEDSHHIIMHIMMHIMSKKFKKKQVLRL